METALKRALSLAIIFNLPVAKRAIWLIDTLILRTEHIFLSASPPITNFLSMPHLKRTSIINRKNLILKNSAKFSDAKVLRP